MTNLVDKVDKIQGDVSEVRVQIARLETSNKAHEGEFDSLWVALRSINEKMDVLKEDRAKETKKILTAVIFAMLTAVGNIIWFIAEHL